MDKQIPRGPDDRWCPQWRKRMSRVCHTCPWWVQIRGQDPQDARREVDQWNCAIALQAPLTIEVGRQQLAVAAAITSMTEEMRKTDKDSEAIIGTLLTMVNKVLAQQALATPALIATAPNQAPELLE